MIIITTTTGARSLTQYVGDKGAIAIQNYQALDENGDAVNLSGYTVTIRVNEDSEGEAGKISFTGACTLTGGGTGGLFSYSPVSTDWDTVGSFLIYFVIAKTGEQLIVRFGTVKVLAAPAAT